MATSTTAPTTKQPQNFAELPVAAKLFILVFLLAVVSAGYYFLLHMDLADQIAAAQAQHTQYEQDLAAAQQRQQEYLRLSQQLVDREPIDRMNKRILPAESEMAAFLQDVNNMAELAGLEIARVEPRAEDPQPMYVRVPVELSLRGKFHQFAKFFYSVSQRDRAISMEDIILKRASTPQRQQRSATATQEPAAAVEEVRLEVEVLATTYHRLPENAPGAAPRAPGAVPGAAPGAVPGAAPAAGGAR